MAEISQKYKYVKLDDGVSFSLVRTNPKLTTNTKLMYNGKKMYMESYTSGSLMNTLNYKNVSVKPNSKFNKDISDFLTGSGSQAYSVYQNMSDIVISDSYDNQFETLYWCGAEYVDSSFYPEEIGFVAPLYLREKLPNYFLIFRLDTPSNYNLNVDENGQILDSKFDFKTDILDKAVLIKTFDLREGSVLGNYIHNYIDQESFEFDKSIYVNFSNAEVTYYGIDKINGVFEKKVESFANELLKNDSPVLKDDKWFTEGFERNGLIFPYIMNIEYLFDDETFKNGDVESYDFARYIGVYCNNIEFGEFVNFDELKTTGETQDNIIYYFEDNKNNLHRYSIKNNQLTIDGKSSNIFDKRLISGFEKERTNGYAEPLDIYEGFINRAQYGFEILKPFEPGDWIGIEYIDSNGQKYVECYFADNKNFSAGQKNDALIGEYSDFRFYVDETSTVNDVAEVLVKCVNNNKKSKFEASYSENVVVFYAKYEGEEYNGTEKGGAKIMLESSLLYNEKISFPISKNINHVSVDDILQVNSDSDSDLDTNIETLFGNYYIDYFCGACNVYTDYETETYKNVFKIYSDEYVFFDIDRYLKTNNGGGRRITTNMIYINAEGKIDYNHRLVIVENVSDDKKLDKGYDVSVSSTYQVEIMDKFKPNYGVLSWFPVKDFDFDINYSTYGEYRAFTKECDLLSKSIKYTQKINTEDSADSDDKSTQENSVSGIKELAKSPFFDDYAHSLDTEYDYYMEQFEPELCILSKTAPYISKWGYYDEQKDSCENSYRLNVNKIFGVSNLSSNTYLRNCDEDEYTHNMPYYLTFGDIDFNKDYQYIPSDKVYNNMSLDTGDSETQSDEDYTFFDCVDYWINIFKKTDEDMFSHFFSGKKYGKRFDRKYSRLLSGDKFHNPSTLFRGVKFEAVRLYNGVEKRSSEYNDYKFSFIYIPVMVNSMVFNNTIHFVKNDTFKFIVGIIFVNTMLGQYNHNIFNNKIDYFRKSFLYAACKDIIRPEHVKRYSYKLTFKYNDLSETETNTSKIFWENNYNINENSTTFKMWKYGDVIFITKGEDPNVIGEFKIKQVSSIVNDIENIKKINDKRYIEYENENTGEIDIGYNDYYSDIHTTIYRKKSLEYYGEIKCELNIPDIEFNGLKFIDVCDAEWNYNNENYGFLVDISKIIFKSESLRNILINIGEKNSVTEIRFYIGEIELAYISKEYITVDIINGSIEISNIINTILSSFNKDIENLKMDITIKDKFDNDINSLAFKDYFSVFNQLSTYSITESINNNYNVKYYSTTEDNKYNIRVIEPDSIEVEDLYEAMPVKIMQNNKNVIGSINIKPKQDIDKIGVKVINRYSGFYNPIFNDILYYDDFTYSKNVSGLSDHVVFELPYSNTTIDYNYKDIYGSFGVIKNMYYHKTNTYRNNKILSIETPIYPAINEYALDYRDYNIFSSSWDEGYFISQDDLDTRSVCDGIGSMKESLCMFGSKYLNLPDSIFIDTFENGKLWDEKMVTDIRDITDTEIMCKEINNSTVRYKLFIEKRLKRYLKDKLIGVFEKYINKNYSFGNKGTIEDDVEEYVEKNLLRLYKVDKVYMYIKSDRMGINNRLIENDYFKYVDKSDIQLQNGLQKTKTVGVENVWRESKFTMSKVNEFDRTITYNLKPGFKESFRFVVSFKRK